MKDVTASLPFVALLMCSHNFPWYHQQSMIFQKENENSKKSIRNYTTNQSFHQAPTSQQHWRKLSVVNLIVYVCGFIYSSLSDQNKGPRPPNCVPEAYILLNDSSQMNVYIVNLIETYAHFSTKNHELPVIHHFWVRLVISGFARQE